MGSFISTWFCLESWTFQLDAKQNYRCETSPRPEPRWNIQTLVQQKEVLLVQIELNHGLVYFKCEKKRLFRLSDQLQEVLAGYCQSWKKRKMVQENKMSCGCTWEVEETKCFIDISPDIFMKESFFHKNTVFIYFLRGWKREELNWQHSDVRCTPVYKPINCKGGYRVMQLM